MWYQDAGAWYNKDSADSVENTVALCPNCHRKMHIVADPNDVERLKTTAKTTHYKTVQPITRR